MILPGHVFTAPDGVRGFDTAEPVTPAAARDFRSRGYRFCVRYVRRDKPHASSLSANEARSLLAAGIGLMLVQYVESETAWNPTRAKGTRNGGIAAAEAEKLGVPWGVTIWCDLEGVASATASQRVIDYCNAWHSAVSGAGYVPGVYVGYHAGLTATQLYRALRFTHYWGAYNLNTDRYPAVRSLQMKQSQPRPQDVVPRARISFQVDKVVADALGGLPTLLAPEGWPEL
jgi:glycoside hydrolase-like protein